jgi:hypothetical protein
LDKYNIEQTDDTPLWQHDGFLVQKKHSSLISWISLPASIVKFKPMFIINLI